MDQVRGRHAFNTEEYINSSQAHTTIREDPGSASNLLPFATSGVLPVDIKATCNLVDLVELLLVNADTGALMKNKANEQTRNCTMTFIFSLCNGAIQNAAEVQVTRCEVGSL